MPHQQVRHHPLKKRKRKSKTPSLVQKANQSEKQKPENIFWLET
jgi:hypothetical protein